MNVGDEIVCIDASPGVETGSAVLVAGKIYIALQVRPLCTSGRTNGLPGVVVNRAMGGKAWLQSRFRLVKFDPVPLATKRTENA